jgi:SsrA-binding protein
MHLLNWLRDGNGKPAAISLVLIASEDLQWTAQTKADRNTSVHSPKISTHRSLPDKPLMLYVCSFMKKAKVTTKEFNNREAYHHFYIDDKAVAGIVLLGTEIKSIREGKVSFSDSFCMFDKGEMWLRGLYIAEYKLGTMNNHIAVHDRKLLLTKRELKKWQAKIKERGFTIVPLRIFFNDKQFCKVEIGLAKGKNVADKRDTIKKRDVEKELKRILAK